jgi:uncharacterized DUF497 family protein
MIDWTRILGFDWDDGNSRKSADKHAVSEAEAEQVFFNQPLLITDDLKHSQTESRYQALGQAAARRPLHVTFTLREEETKIRTISARDMNRKEKSRYGQEN